MLNYISSCLDTKNQQQSPTLLLILSSTMQITLLGNPNVGKSSLFNHMTGADVAIANYPGTTIHLTSRIITCPACDRCTHTYTLFDAPGVYQIAQPTNKYEAITHKLMCNSSLLINVIDATHLAQSLTVTQTLLSGHNPCVIALNRWDEAQDGNIAIDLAQLKKYLQVPIIPTIARTGFGIKDLEIIMYDYLHRTPTYHIPRAPDNLATIDTIVSQTERRAPQTKTIRQKLEVLLISPLPGGCIALIMLCAIFASVAYSGMIIEWVCDTLLNMFATPLMLHLHHLLAPIPFLQATLIGTISVDGTINYGEALGLLTSGLYIPLIKVAPVVILFYGILGILEESGYLPRLATLSDSFMRRFSLHGFAILPMILGAGCSVTGIVATRMLTSRRERIIVSALVSMIIPCTSQTAIIISLLGPLGTPYVFALFGLLALLWCIVGMLFGLQTQVKQNPLLLELPPLQRPSWWAIGKKLHYRTRSFFKDALPLAIAGIALVACAQYFDLFSIFSRLLTPVCSFLWGLPPRMVPILIIGLFRKEIALSFLLLLPDLSATQLFIAATLLSIYFPCISVYTMLYREFGSYILGMMVLAMLGLSTTIGMLLHHSIRLF